MDEEQLREMTERLLVVAGALMEDASPPLVRGRRNLDRLRADATMLERTADELQAIARCALVLAKRAPQGG